MSFLQQHYEKIALGVGGVSLLGLLVYGYMNYSDSDAFMQENAGHANKTASEAETLNVRIRKARGTFDRVDEVVDVTMKDAPRDLFMFKSYARYGKKGSKQPLDPLEKDSEQIHPPIPNEWWFKNRLDGVMKYENALKVDSDGDGFTNGEEYAAKTDPSKKTDYPELLPKLFALQVDAHDFKLSFNASVGTDIFLRVRDKIDGFDREEDIKVGESVFERVGAKGQRYKNRFKYVGQKTVKNEFGDNVAAVELLDTKAVKEKEKIVFTREKPAVVYDLSVDLALTVLGKSSDIQTFKLGQSFSLPFGEATKDYTVKSIVQNGEVYDVTIEKKGGMSVTLQAPQKR